MLELAAEWRIRQRDSSLNELGPVPLYKEEFGNIRIGIFAGLCDQHAVNHVRKVGTRHLQDLTEECENWAQ